ncbi:hypothetical protein TNCV_1287071 [Trichonephila clavipes]|nr:hypothetical protein TNCV_1287071 [Trichonephila clavipes]
MSLGMSAYDAAACCQNSSGVDMYGVHWIKVVFQLSFGCVRWTISQENELVKTVRPHRRIQIILYKAMTNESVKGMLQWDSLLPCEHRTYLHAR